MGGRLGRVRAELNAVASVCGRRCRRVYPFAGTAGKGPGVVGPVEIDHDQFVRWAAVGQDCPLVVTINDVEIASTSVDGFAEGEVALFDYPEPVGKFDIEIDTECSWTLSHGTYQG